MTDAVLYMRRCQELAQLGKGHAAPNPMVGAVLVHKGRIIGEGWHKEYGQNHAEVNCLESVAEADKALIPESTMYVSLEPCAHYGKTPPCSLRLVQEKVKEVIICNIDPFEKVEGRGLKILADAGIRTSTGILEKEGRWLNRRFYCFHEQKRPYIILKWAQTETGYFAPADRSRMQLSNVYSKQLLHKWRTEEAAIMVGTTTALQDDPQLTARLWKGKQPLRIVLDKELKLPDTLQLFNNDAMTWIVNSKKEATVGPIHYIQLPFDDNLLPALMQRLHTANITSIIIEGGVQLLNSFINAGLWDEARVFTAPKDIAEGITAPALTHSHEALQVSLEEDTLHLYINNNSKYPYADGMEL